MNYSLNGSDTITLNGTLLTKFFDKDYGLLTFPNEVANMKVGKSGNAVITKVSMGTLGELTLRILLGTSDDSTINSIQRAWLNDPASFVLASGQVVKRTGDGKGNIRNVVYSLYGGVPVMIPESHSNSDGDEEQGVAIWKLKFANGSRQML